MTDDRLNDLARLAAQQTALADGDPAVGDLATVGVQTAAALEWAQAEVRDLRRLRDMYRSTVGRTPTWVHALIDAWATGGALNFNGEPVPEDVQMAISAALERREEREQAGEFGG